MKIAISQWQGRISPVFDVSDNLCLIEIENGREIQRTNVLLSNRHTFRRAKEISDLGTDVLCCGAVSHVLETALISTGIQVFSFICGDLEDVAAAFEQGKWEADLFLMPGFRRKGQTEKALKEKYHYLFGPVPSRRFGRSLGIDLTPYKTCSLDCVFCQLGRTRNKTVSRKEYVSTDVVLAELKDWLKTNGKADYITLSGSGEPTLHSHFGEVLEFIRKNSTIPAVLLTNGTMLYLPQVQEEAAKANVVKVSLSVWNRISYGWVNRPHPKLRFDQLVEGQKAFRAKFKGQLWLEVFLVKGINSMPDDVRKIAAMAKEIKPDRIQLNTAIRPPAEDFVMALSHENMEELTHLFCPAAEIIAEYSPSHTDSVQANQDTIFSMLQRRPCTMEEIADIFGMHINEASKYLGILMRSGLIRAERKNSAVYYAAVRTERKSNTPYEFQYQGVNTKQ